MRTFKMELTEKEAWACAVALEEYVLTVVKLCKAGKVSRFDIEHALNQLNMLLTMNEILMTEEQFREQRHRLYGFKGYLTRQLEILEMREEVYKAD